MSERTSHALAIALALVAALTLGSMNGLAQNAQQNQQTAPVEISNEDLQAFASASLEVQEISQQAKAQMASAEGSSEQEAVQQQAMEQMREAVQQSGLSVDRYNQIYQIAQADPQVASRIREYMVHLD